MNDEDARDLLFDQALTHWRDRDAGDGARAVALQALRDELPPVAQLRPMGRNPKRTSTHANRGKHPSAATGLPRRATNGVETYTPEVDDSSEQTAAVAEFTAARRAKRLAAIGVALAVLFCWFGLPSIRNTAPPNSTAKVATSSTELHQVAHTPGPPAKRIEDIQLGDRVAGRNPHREEVELVEPDEATWREVRLRLKKDDGSSLTVDLLRPLEWLSTYRAEVGGVTYLDMPEFGANGDAEVLSIERPRDIDAGAGGVVTAIFRHEVRDGSIVQITLKRDGPPLRVTAKHPFWSVTRDDFVNAADLQPGESLDTLDGPSAIVTIERIPYSGIVYNLETTEHVFRVDESGCLVHNACEELHHAIPKFLGGAIKQVRIPLKTAIHREFHSVLRQELRAAGFALNVGGRGGGRANWIRHFSLNSGSQRRAFDAVLNASRSIDAKYGTSITQSFWAHIMNKAFDPF